MKFKEVLGFQSIALRHCEKIFDKKLRVKD